MTYARRVDENHSEIMQALRKAGASVWSLHKLGEGAPDLLIGWCGRNYLVEVKQPNLPPSKRLTPDEEKWHRNWRGQVAVVETAHEAILLLNKLSMLGRALP